MKQNDSVQPKALATDPERERRWLIVDVRTPAEYQEAHIPGSCNVPLPDLAGSTPELKSRAQGKSIVLTCRSGGRARQALEQLRAQGLDCCLLEGSLTAWIEQGLPVNRGKKAISLERQVRIAAGALVVLGVAGGFFLSSWILILPAFVGSGLVFSGVTDTCGMAMLLAKLPYNRSTPKTSGR